MDPPWRIKGAQRYDTSFMFSNNNFRLNYDTMSNKEILALDIGVLTKRGFMFLWVLSSQVDTGIEALEKWGYKLIDSIVWVKTRGNNISVSHGFYFLHSTETCLVGYKNVVSGSTIPPPDIPKIGTNLIVSDIREKSRKPDELYEMIEMMFPWAQKLEIFARNHNLRKGWLSLGNQLGDQYKVWKQQLMCDNCHKSIEVGNPRFKAKFKSNHDLCEKCAYSTIQDYLQKEGEQQPESPLFKSQPSPLTQVEKVISIKESSPIEEQKESDQKEDQELQSQDSIQDEQSQKKKRNPHNELVEKLLEQLFYRIENLIEDEVFHNYRVCNECKCDPIWGVLFHCLECHDYDICETCYDKDLEKESPHSKKHQFGFYQYPELGHGMPVHTGYQCCLCFQNPILGPMILCQKCNPFNTCYCQNCFLTKQMVYTRGHKEQHQYRIILNRDEEHFKDVKCAVCNLPIEMQLRYRCLDCYEFNLCPNCYTHRRNDKPKYSSLHKSYHRFEKLYFEQVHDSSDHDFNINARKKDQ